MAYTDAPTIDRAVSDAVDRVLPDVMTIPELSARLQLSAHGVRNLIERGEIPGVVRLGRRIRISRKAVDRWLDGFAVGAA